MKTIIVLFVLSATLTGALAFNFGGDGTQFGHMGAFPKAGTGGSGSSCSNQLDFTQSCNSQYLTVLH